MNKMIGASLMILGGISFIIGFYVYSKAGRTEPLNSVASIQKNENKASVRDTSNLSAAEDVQPVKTNGISNIVKGVTQNLPKEDLQEAISIAIADGVLTNNEKALLKKISLERGRDYESVLKEAETQMTALGIKSETELIDQNKKSGLDFEKFVVKKFNRRYFDVTEWTGDKYVEGRFSKANYHPDLLMKLKSTGVSERFSIECKWRRRFAKEIIVASESQIGRYRQYETKMNVPVFIALGLGGTGDNPIELYIIPLKQIHSNILSMAWLKQYEKDVARDLSFDLERQVIY